MPQLGRYILERTLAHGGMGEVHLAHQTGPNGYDRTCVVKTMHANLADDPELVEMFLEEARLTAKLTHAHIAQVYDFGKIDSAYYMAMELVDGPSLHTVIKSYGMRRRPVPMAPAVRMISQAAQALDYVHRLKGPDGGPLNLVHRDISPGNLLLSKEGMVKLVDFGIAKANTTARRTKMGQVRGKLAYMSPEQLLGLPLDGRTDIYSLGLVLYELLAGRRAMAGKNEVEILSSIKTGKLDPIGKLRSDCPPRLLEVLDRAVTRDRDQRFARASDLSQGLEHVLLEMGAAVGPDELTAIAEEVALPANMPRPSPAQGPRFSPPNAATVTGASAAAVSSSGKKAEATFLMNQPQSVTGPMPGASRKVAFMALGALMLITAGLTFALLARTGDKPAAPVAMVPAAKTPAAAPVPAGNRVEPPALPAQAAAEPGAPPPPGNGPVPPHPPPRLTHGIKSVSYRKPPPGDAPESKAAARVAAVTPEPEPQPAPTPSPAPVAAPAPTPGPPPTTGTLSVKTDPPMEIVIDGQIQGVAPRTLTLQPGAHDVTLREPRLKLEHRQSVSLTAGSSAEVSWKPSHGLVDVRAVPPDVELQIGIDGETVGTTPLPEMTVWEGPRQVTAVNRATGWRTEQRIDVPAGSKVKLKVKDGAGIEVAH
jgi:serine/threonine-protein kinase